MRMLLPLLLLVALLSGGCIALIDDFQNGTAGGTDDTDTGDTASDDSDTTDTDTTDTDTADTASDDSDTGDTDTTDTETTSDDTDTGDTDTTDTDTGDTASDDTDTSDTDTADTDTSDTATDDTDTGDTDTEIPRTIILYPSPTVVGNLVLYSSGATPRESADLACADSIPVGLTCHAAHAMVSFSAADQVKDMPSHLGFPADVPIESETGIPFADDWTDLMDGSISNTMNDGGLFPAASDNYYWSASDGAGLFKAANNCSGWTAIDSGVTGYVGASYLTDGGWLDDNRVFPCASELPMLCACVPEMITPENPVRNASFESSSDWTTSTNVTIDPAAGGANTPGSAVLSLSSGNSSGYLTQSNVTLESFAGTQPMGITLSLAWAGSSRPYADLNVLLGGEVVASADLSTVLPWTANTWVSWTGCLGDAFTAGGEGDLRIEVADYFDMETVSVLMDDVTIGPVSADVCPAVGDIVNADFENGTTGWSSYSSVPVSVDPEDGTNHALRIYWPSGCTGGTDNIVRGRISIPLATTLANSALRFQLKGDLTNSSNPFTARYEYDGTSTSISSWSSLPVTWQTYTYCLPDALKGRVVDIVYAIGVNCGDGFREMWVDNLEVVSDGGLCP